jgi:hypothetical protein
MASIADRLLKSQFKSNLEKQQDIFERNAENQAKKEGKLSSFMKIATPLAGLALMATPVGPFLAAAGTSLGGTLGLSAAASTALGSGLAKAGTNYLGGLATEEGARTAGMGATSEAEQKQKLQSEMASLGPVGRAQAQEAMKSDLQVTQETARDASGDSRVLGSLAAGVGAGLGKYATIAETGAEASSQGLGAFAESYADNPYLFNPDSVSSEDVTNLMKQVGVDTGKDLLLKRQDGGIIPSVDARKRSGSTENFYSLY